MRKVISILSVVYFCLNGSIKAQLAGDYTIGSGQTDYPTISDAVNDLVNFGVNAPVKFIIKDGFYPERFEITNVAGVTNMDTILFVAESENPSSVEISVNASNQGENYILKLNGVNRVTFEGVTFKTTSSHLCNAVRFEGGASYNRLLNCIFLSDYNVTAAGDSGTVIINGLTGSLEQYNEVIKCDIDGGGTGLVFTGESNSSVEKGTKIIGNKFTNQTRSVANMMYSGNGKFEQNRINYTGSEATTSFQLDSLFEIVGNRIFSTGLSETALYIAGHDWALPKDTLFVVNNMLSCKNGSAFRGEYIKGMVIAHNTMYSENVTRYTLALDQINIVLSINNLFLNNSNNGVVQITNEGLIVGSDHNGVWSMSGEIGLRDDGIKNNLATWQAGVNSPDPNSKFGSMAFKDYYTDLTPICGISNDFITNNYQSQLSHDINGVQRDPAGFWMGAVEFALGSDHTIGLKGYVTDGTDTLKDAAIEVYADTSDKVLLDLVYSAAINTDGSYDFSDVPYSNEYWLKILPNSSLAPDYIEAYHNNELRWDDGAPHVSSDSCGIYDKDIFPRKIQDITTGTYMIRGNVSENSGANKTMGTDPIPGLDVVLDKIPPSRNTVAVTQTDVDGNYFFENLPGGTYVVTIDYEGLPADTIYEVVLNEENDTVANMNYCVDTAYQIEGCFPSDVSSSSFDLEGLKVYPNPIADNLSIAGILGEFNITIVDVEGRILINKNSNNLLNVNTSALSSGVYFVVIKTKTNDQVIKVVK